MTKYVRTESGIFEALETLKDMLIGNGCNDNINEYVDNLILPIKQALQRLKSIDNTKPNEVLEIIRKCENSNYLNTLYPKFVEDLKTVENYILKSQEQEKLLMIILKKQVDINEIKIMISNLKHCDDIERCKRYNASRKVGYKLKQDEFNSIKEMLNNE